MKEVVIKCDRCGEDISPSVILYGNRSHIKFELNYWHGGSIGGDEDIDKFELDLCDDCSRELSHKIKEWLKTQNKIKNT